MRKRIISLCILSFMLLGSVACTIQGDKSAVSSEQSKNIPYRIGENYYIVNDIEALVPHKISTQQEFDSYFGMAAIKGKGPTNIDFKKEFVLVIDTGDTENKTNLQILRLVKKGGKIILEYKLDRGERQGYTSRPFKMLIVNKKHDAEVVLSSK